VPSAEQMRFSGRDLYSRALPLGSSLDRKATVTTKASPRVATRPACWDLGVRICRTRFDNPVDSLPRSDRHGAGSWWRWRVRPRCDENDSFDHERSCRPESRHNQCTCSMDVVAWTLHLSLT
jgi:hypothetical protein